MEGKEEQLEREIAAWPDVTVQPHRFGGREFLFGNAELGHVHRGGTVDIPFPRGLRDLLIEKRLAEEHRWVPDSGWITFRIRSEEGLKHALWLMRLSYVRYALKRQPDPASFFKQEREALHLSSELAALLAQMMPSTAR